MSLNLTPTITIKKRSLKSLRELLEKNLGAVLGGFLAAVAIGFFVYFYQNNLSLTYNDARSHLDIGRRVVEGLKPGLAQLGSVWLPLPHLLMVPTVWIDFMWQSGLSGSIQSMISFVAVNLLIYAFLKKLGVGLVGRLMGVAVFVANLNVLYLQSTAMTELLLLATMTAGMYEFVMWHKEENLLYLIRSAFWVMLASLIRYEGWFLLIFMGAIIVLQTWRKRGYKVTEGTIILFTTLAAFGIGLWVLWNALIFKDPLYFIFGPFSARTQQKQIEEAGLLITRGNLLTSFKVYMYALIYNSNTVTFILGLFGAVALWADRKLKPEVRIAAIVLIAPLLFNVLALYLGHSVLFVKGYPGNSWFNVRYGLMMLPTVAIFVGYLTDKLKNVRPVIIGLFIFVTFFTFTSSDAVTIEDAQHGSSGKNVSEVSSFLKEQASQTKGFILISAASHDAIIFSTGLPMKRYIHEGTGSYWESATTSPDRWARWIVARTHDDNDLTWKAISKVPTFADRYDLVASYPFADVYELKAEYVPYLETEPVLAKQK